MKACELVGVSRRTIYNWLSSGKIEYVRTAGGSVRIFVDTLWRDPHRQRSPGRAGAVAGRRPEPGLMSGPLSVEELLARGPMDESPELRLLFHRLNNQLGIILAHAELLEAKAPDDMTARARGAGRRERPRGDGHRQRNPPPHDRSPPSEPQSPHARICNYVVKILTS